MGVGLKSKEKGEETFTAENYEMIFEYKNNFEKSKRSNEILLQDFKKLIFITMAEIGVKPKTGRWDREQMIKKERDPKWRERESRCVKWQQGIKLSV